MEVARRLLLLVGLLVASQAYAKPLYDSMLAETDDEQVVSSGGSHIAMSKDSSMWVQSHSGDSGEFAYVWVEGTDDGRTEFCETDAGTFTCYNSTLLDTDIVPTNPHKRMPTVERHGGYSYFITYWDVSDGITDIEFWDATGTNWVEKGTNPKVLEDGAEWVAQAGDQCQSCNTWFHGATLMYTDQDDATTYVEGCTQYILGQNFACGSSWGMAKTAVPGGSGWDAEWTSGVRVRRGNDQLRNGRAVFAFMSAANGNDGYAVGVGMDEDLMDGGAAFYFTSVVEFETGDTSHVAVCSPPFNDQIGDGSFAIAYNDDDSNAVKVVTGRVYGADDTPTLAIGTAPVVVYAEADGRWISCAFMHPGKLLVQYASKTDNELRVTECSVTWTSDTAQTVTCEAAQEVLTAYDVGNLDSDATFPQLATMLRGGDELDPAHRFATLDVNDGTGEIRRRIYDWSGLGRRTGRQMVEGFEGQLDPQYIWNTVNNWVDYGTATKWDDEPAKTDGGMWIVEGHMGDGIGGAGGADPCSTCQSDFYLALSFPDPNGIQDAFLNLEHQPQEEVVAGLQINQHCSGGFLQLETGDCIDRKLIEARAFFGEDLCFLALGADGIVRTHFADATTYYCGNEAFNTWTECDPNDPAPAGSPADWPFNLRGNRDCIAETEPFNAQETINCVNTLAFDSITPDVPAHVALVQDTSPPSQPFAVSCGLWRDGHEVSSGTVFLGKCTSLHDGFQYACAQNTDCDDVANDPNADIGPCITNTAGPGVLAYQTTFGARRVDATETSSGNKNHYEIDSITLDVGDENAGNTHSRVAVLKPNADGTTIVWEPVTTGNPPADCDNVADPDWQCVYKTDLFEGGDGGRLTGGKEAFQLFEFDALVLADPNEQVPADAAVFLSAIVDAVGNDPSDEVELRSVQANAAGTSFEYGRLFEIADQADYHLGIAGLFQGEPPGASAWTKAKYDAMEAGFERRVGDAAAGLSKRMIAQVEVSILPEPVHLTLSDQNKDTFITVGVSGDSRHLGTTTWSIFPSRLLQADFVYMCAGGGVPSWDTHSSWAGAFSPLDGKSCLEFKGGATGKPVDYMFLDVGFNDPDIGPIEPVTGFCYQYSDPNVPTPGPQHGQACQIASGRASAKYCVKGADYKSTCAFVSTGEGVFQSDCLDGGVTAETDESLGPMTCNHQNWNLHCHRGALNQHGCEDGVCVQFVSPEYTADYFRGMSNMIQTRLADPNDANSDTLLILVKPVYTCTTPAAFDDPNFGCIDQLQDWVQAQHHNYEGLIDRYNYDWIDLQAVFRAKCPDHDIDNCMSDCVHWNDIGEALFAEAMEGCLEADPAWNTAALGFMSCTNGIDPNGRVD